MEEKTTYNTGAPLKEYKFTIDFIVEVPPHLNPETLFDTIHDNMVTVLSAMGCQVGGDWSWEAYHETDNQDP